MLIKTNLIEKDIQILQSLTHVVYNIDALNNYNLIDHIFVYLCYMYLFHRWRSSTLDRTGGQREYWYEIVAKIGRDGWKIVERTEFQMASRWTQNVEASPETRRITKNQRGQFRTWMVLAKPRFVLRVNNKPTL